MRDTHQKFSSTTLRLHWLIAIGMIAMLALGLIMVEMADSPIKFQLIDIHKSIGMLIVPFALWRIVWRIRNGFPQPVGDHGAWEHRLAKLIHYVLIIGTALLPISGMLMSGAAGYGIAFFGLQLVVPNFVDGQAIPFNEVAAGVGYVLHNFGGKLLILGVVLHVVGALKHHMIDKDTTLSRMLGRKS